MNQRTGEPPREADGALDSRAEPLADRSRVLRAALTRYFGRYVNDTAEIDDLIQDVFLRIVRRGGANQFDRLDGYIFQTASSVLKDRNRRRKTRHTDRHVLFEADAHGGTAPGPEQVLCDQEALRSAGLVIMELPERTRAVFVLRRLEACSYNEISRRLGLSVSAVEKHMLRATRHILARMGDIR
ncbi:MAG: RNA polymerase sigma factor [Caulobacteraceae bacterium]